MSKKHRLTVTLDDENYLQIQNIAHKQGKSMSEILRTAAMESLTVSINVENIDMITDIIRTQLRDILQPSVERLATLSAKTCVQAAAAAYLAAEAIGKFVPPAQQEDVVEAYNQARRKGVEYTRRKSETNDIKEEYM